MKLTSLLAGTALVASTVMLASPASAAKKSYDPNVTRLANPATVCKSIPGTVKYAGELFGMPFDLSDFHYSKCVRTAARGGFEVPGFGDPYAQCDLLVQAGVFSYPTVLHDEEGDPFPDLLIKNRKQCGNALYAFHAIESYFPAEPTS